MQAQEEKANRAHGKEDLGYMWRYKLRASKYVAWRIEHAISQHQDQAPSAVY